MLFRRNSTKSQKNSSKIIQFRRISTEFIAKLTDFVKISRNLTDFVEL